MSYGLAVSPRYKTATLDAGDTVVDLGSPDPFPVIAATDVKVFRTRAGARAQLVLDADYAVSLLNQLPGARVTLAASALQDDIIEVVGERPIARPTDLNDGQKFNEEILNGEFDASTIQQQEARRDIDRAWKSTFGQAGGLIVGGAPGELMMTDASGNVVSSGENVTSILGSTEAAVTAAQMAAADSVLAQLARALAQQYAADAAQVSGVNVPIYASVATARDAIGGIAAGVKTIRTQFYNPSYAIPATLIGGAPYMRVSAAVAATYPALAQFRSIDRYMPDGTTDAVNGGYWIITGDTLVTPQMFGAKVDGVTDDTAAIRAARDVAVLANLTLYFPKGVYGVASGNPLTSAIPLTAPMTVAGAGMFLAEIKALSACSSIIEWNPASGGEYLHMTGLQLTGNNVATECFSQLKGLVQGSLIDRIRCLNPVSKGWGMYSYIYKMKPEIVCSGGDYGIFIQGNGPTNGANFQNLRVSGTNIRAFHCENTAISTSSCVLTSPTFEGNKGGAIYAKNVDIEAIGQPYFENNGNVNGDPDILIDSASNIVSSVKLLDPKFSTAGAAQNNIRVRLLATATRIIIHGGNTSPTTFIIDGNNQVSSTRIELYNAKARVINRSQSVTHVVDDGIQKFGNRSFNAAPTATGVASWGSGAIEIVATLRSTNTVLVGKYLLSLDNSPAAIHWVDNVACATTANIALSGEQTLDGVLTAASRVLVKNQTDQKENGIYVSAAGAWARAADADTSAELGLCAARVNGGTTLGGTSWRCTNAITVVIGTDNVAFSQLSGATLAAVACATVANITLSGEQTLDGILTAASRVLVKNQNDPRENGVYVSAAGAWARANDVDTAAEINQSSVRVTGGTAQAGTIWRCINTNTATIGTVNITYARLIGGCVPIFVGGADIATFSDDRGELMIGRPVAGSAGTYWLAGQCLDITNQS